MIAVRLSGSCPECDLDIAIRTRRLIALAHPDEWPTNELAAEVTKRLNVLRGRLS